MNNLLEIVKQINSILWGPPMMILLGGFGLFATFYFGFPQFRLFGLGWRESFGKIFEKDEEKKEGSMSSFQSLATAVAAQVGTGNIGGIAGAMATGGPGAIFWMWLTAFLGMATIAIEAALAQKYRHRDEEGQLVGGPSYYISKGLEVKGHKGLGKFLAVLFAVLIVLSLGFIGNMVQANSIAGSLNKAFGINPLYIGIAIALIAALIFVGGMDRIAKFAEIIVPFMALVYFVGALFALYTLRGEIIPMLQLIFKSAFSFKAVAGGVVGYTIKTAIRYGVARGLFSNEAGMGSTPNSHAVADVDHPVIQSAVAMLGVFIDTMIVCTATAMLVLTSGVYTSDMEGVQLTMGAFNHVFGSFGSTFVAVALLFFALTTIVGWYYFGEGNVKFLFKSKWAVRIYQALVVGFIILGATQKVELVWELADMFNALMVIPNIIGLFFLVKEAKKLFDDYNKQSMQDIGLHYTYPYENETIK